MTNAFGVNNDLQRTKDKGIGTPGPKPRKTRETYRPSYEYTDEQVELLKHFDEWRRENQIKFPSIIQMVEFLEFLELQGYRKAEEHEATDVRDWDGTGIPGKLWSRFSWLIGK